MISHIVNSKDSIDITLDKVRKISKVAGYKINTQKSAVFLYTKNKIILMSFKFINIDRNQTSDFWRMRKSGRKRVEGKGYKGV